MKVTYNSPHFYIDGVQVINPEVFNLKHSRLSKSHYIRPQTDEMVLKDGDSFELPENIIAEKDVMCGYHNLNCTYCGTCAGDCYQPKEVYRLKLKEPLVEMNNKRVEWLDKNCPTNGYIEHEPLVDTGSKETQEQLWDEIRNELSKTFPSWPKIKNNYFITRNKYNYE